MDQGGSVMSVEKDMVGTLRRETHGHEPIIAHAVAVDVYNQAIDGDTTATLTEACGGTNTSGPKIMQPIALAENTIGRQPENGGNGDGFTEGGPMYTLNATGVHGVAQPIPYDLHQVTAPVNRQSRVPGDPCHTLAKQNAHNAAIVQTIAFSSNMSVPDCQEDVSPTLKLGGHGGGNPPAVMQPVDIPEVMSTLTSSMSGVSRPGNATTEHETYIPMGQEMQMAVRRLTPRECERLQGFPDDHTQIPWRGKPADQCPDGPRYKALGNSMAVPVMRWIGERIRMVNELQK